MNKKISFLVFACVGLFCTSCATPEEPDISLGDYTITTNINLEGNENLPAEELTEALNNAHELSLVTKGVESVEKESHYIHLAIDENQTANTYSITKSGTNFLLTSDTTSGLFEAARDFLNTTTTVDKSSTWYSNATLDKEYTVYENVKVMSYNVRVGDDTLANGETGTVAKRLPRIAKHILELQPDSVGVQEHADPHHDILKAKLFPKYGYVGWGRENNYKGERSGIFYNRDKLTLLHSDTKWMSDTPDVSGTKFPEAGNWFRIMTSAIFQRNHDGFVYMHINTHFDLTSVARFKDAQFIADYASQYTPYMPVIITGDFNSQESTQGDAIQYFLNDCHYVDSKKEAKITDDHWTYPVEGYYKNEIPQNERIVIDFIFKASKGIYFTKYDVDTTKYSGDGTEPASITSDHYPIYGEAQLYAPLTDFEPWNYGEGDVAINNRYVIHDSQFNVISTKSPYKNLITKLAVDADKTAQKGLVKPTTESLVKYQCLGNLAESGDYLEYQFNSDVAGTADIVVALSSSMYNSNPKAPKTNFHTPNLGAIVTLNVNNSNVNLDGLKLRNTDIALWYEWELLVLKDYPIVAGTNKVKFTTKQNSTLFHPNQLLLEVFSDTTLS